MTRGDIAKNLFLEGYNCSQAVAGAFSDILKIDKETLIKLSSSFGGGMGRLREVCGAVSGMFIVLGILEGYTDASDNTHKKEHYENIQKLAEEFRKENGAIVCRELLGLTVKKDDPTPEKRNGEYYKKRPCAELVKSAADILEKYLNFNS